MDHDTAPETALQAAASTLGPMLAGCCILTPAEIAGRVTSLAEIYLAWLRRPVRITLELVAIEEQDTGAAVPTEGMTVTTIDSSQQARYVISAADDRGFAVDASLAAESSDPAIVSVELLEASTGTASGKDELVAKFVSPGSALIKVFDPAQADTVFGSDNIDAVPGGVAAVVLETPTIEEQPTP